MCRRSPSSTEPTAPGTTGQQDRRGRRLAGLLGGREGARLRFVVLLAATSVPLWLPSAHVYDLGRVAATDAVLAVGYCIVLGLCGQFSVAHAALFGVGAYTTAILTAQHGVGSLPALGASVAAGGLAGALVGLPALRVAGDQLAVVTLGIGEVAQLVMLDWTRVTGGFSGISDIPPPNVFGWRVVDVRDTYLLAAASLLVVVAATDLLRRSPAGLAMRAIREDEAVARAAGVRVGLWKVVAFALSGGIAGLAGWLYAGSIVSISPADFGIVLSVLVAVMVLIGGPGRVYGAVVGAGLIATLQDQLVGQAAVEDGVTGLAIVAVALWSSGVGASLRQRVLRR